MSLNTTPRTWVTAETVTAAEMNTETRDGFTGIQAAWTSYTPTLTGITLGNGTLSFAWSRVGKTIQVRGAFNAGSTTTYSATTLAFSLPVAALASYATVGRTAVGAAFIDPTSGTRWPGSAYINTSGTLSFIAGSAANALVTNLVPGTFSTSSTLSFTAEYEAA